MRGLLGRLFALAEDVIGAHGGTLEKFIGDAIFAVFGMPQAHGDGPIARIWSRWSEPGGLV